jgi:hypothetical protein
MRGLLLLLLAGQAMAGGFSGHVAVEARHFFQSSRSGDTVDDNVSLSAQPKWQWALGRDDELTLELFARIDDREGRQHGDIRELRWLHLDGDNEWRIGIDSVFWGVTESRHLVDVINSTDRLEGLDGEDRLGQPMIHYTRLTTNGAFELFLLPGFRPAHYADVEARLTPPLPVAERLAQYESADEERHVDAALRYAASLGDHEIGLSLFRGTQREPEFVGGTQGGRPVLIPYYPQMTQWGLDLQSIVGDWTWKLEAIRREREDGHFNAVTAGFEYSFYGIFESALDLGLLLEYSDDDRDDAIFDQDWFGGLRLAFNDVQSSEILAGLLYDAGRHSRSLRVEASRRLGDSWKLNLELQTFSGVAADDPMKLFERDDYLQLELAYYF